MDKKTGLIILDGWGIGDQSNSDAIYKAKTPVMDSLMTRFPSTTLTTFGNAVGLPKGQMGNSEVGHLNIGAGRIVYQELTRINHSIETGEFFKKKNLVRAFELSKQKGSKIHFIGLVSKGGVHSTQEHLYALCNMAKTYALDPNKVFIHAFTDGRDCDPKSGLGFVRELEEHLTESVGRIASVVGRYYSMDRDNRWERIQKAYELMTKGEGSYYKKASEAVEQNYNLDITDEFIEPSIILKDGIIENNDVVICFNFRTDRPREISSALTQKAYPEFGMQPLNIDYFTMTNYDQDFNGVNVIFEKENLNNTIGETLSANGKKQLRIAETEKYPHVTFFFNGGREESFKNEERILVESPKVATYDLYPEMSAHEITDKALEYMVEERPDFICLNFANPDMVGHTGVYPAIIKAVETVDKCLGSILETGLEHNYEFLVIADHGNADFAVNQDGSPNTAHTLNPVPAIFLSNEDSIRLRKGILADVAPTILERMGIAPPKEMTGKSLIH
jgi:2,3-bisphosphoglycerate-independent phosphoglycerate mutase